MTVDGYVPGMVGLRPKENQITGAASFFAKESETGKIESVDGKHQYETLPTMGGIRSDVPGGGKTLMAIMHLQNTINRLKPGEVHRPNFLLGPRTP